MDTCHYIFIQTHRKYKPKSEPQCKIWTLGDNDVSVNLLKSSKSSINNFSFCEHFNTVANEKETESF